MKWQEEEEHLLRLLIPTNSYQEIAEEFARRLSKRLPGFSQERSYDAVRRKCTREGITAENVENYNTDPYGDRWESIKATLAEYALGAEHRSFGLVETVGRKILCISDLHFPFCLVDECTKAMELHSDANICVFNGDILDGFIFSTFGKARRVAALHEYRGAFELVRIAQQMFPLVVITSGNHDVRPAKALARADFEKDASQIFRPDLLARIANGEELNESGELIKKHDFENVVYQPYDSWYVRIGKTVFCHPSAWRGSYPGGTVIKLNDYFTQRLGSEAFDSIVVGHTHRQYKGIVGNVMLIEQGAMCARQPYQHKDDLRYIHAMNGYAVIYQDTEGNTCFNRSNFIHLGSQLPPKKDILL
jgi:predicted phosphodiesterase